MFEIDYCLLCKAYFVRCRTCGNNCCNAMYGEIDGKPCPDCPKAYQYQEELDQKNLLIAR